MSDHTLFSAVNGGPDNRYRLEMAYDLYAESPRNYMDSLWHLRFAGRDFEGLSDNRKEWSVKENKFKYVLDTLPRYYDDFKDELKELKEKGWLIAPIHGYSHSGITISLSNEYPYNDQWDGGTVGFALLDPAKLLAEKMTPEQAYKILQSEINDLDYYCRGEVFEFTLLKWGEVVESCGNVLGDTRELVKDCAQYFRAEFAPLFDELAYGRVDPILDYNTNNAAMEAYVI